MALIPKLCGRLRRLDNYERNAAGLKWSQTRASIRLIRWTPNYTSIRPPKSVRKISWTSSQIQNRIKAVGNQTKCRVQRFLRGVAARLVEVRRVCSFFRPITSKRNLSYSVFVLRRTKHVHALELMETRSSNWRHQSHRASLNNDNKFKPTKTYKLNMI